MASSSSPTPNGGGRKLLFAPGAEFTPKAFESKGEVLKASFVTQTAPNIPNCAGIVGLCAIPEEKAGMDDLGWHIADFLSFRALLCGDNNPRAQSWLSMCDIARIVQENPERYVHGRDRRLVGSTASSKYQGRTGLVEREDNIQVETSAEALKDKFFAAVKKKLEVLKTHQYPLLIIICGLTSLEQDIYLGQIDIDHRYTMKDLRQDLGDDINHIDTTVVTPALFSAGWQVNTSFGRRNSTKVYGNRVDFLARQFGGLFARQLVPMFLGWQCPAIDEAKLDPHVKSLESFPGPVQPSDEVKALTTQLEMKIHSSLLGELSAFPKNHSFSFDKSKDEWDTIINSRDNRPDRRSLDWYEQKWHKLPLGQSLDSTDKGFEFLGDAFGGTRVSQLHHLTYLIEESYLAWPDHWAYTYGQETKKDLERFKILQNPDSLECQEILYVLEHRARMSILGDTIVQYFDLPMPQNERCRDFNNHKWKHQLPETVRRSLIKHFGAVMVSVPGPNVPPGLNINGLSKLQRRLESCASYIRASLAIRFLTSQDACQVAVERIGSFLQDVKQKQLELLAGNTEIHGLCCDWLNAIDIPARDLYSAVMAIESSQGRSTPEAETGPLDCDDDYEIYQDGEAHFDYVATSAVVESPVANFHGRQPSQPQTPTAPVQERGYCTDERTVRIDPRITQDVITASPVHEVTQTQQGATQSFPQELLTLEAEKMRLRIEMKSTTDGRARYLELAEKLMALLEKENELLLRESKLLSNAKTAADDTSKDVNADLRISPVKESVPVEERMEEEERYMDKKRIESNIQEVQENLEKITLSTRREEEVITGRKTPPHLRGIRRFN